MRRIKPVNRSNASAAQDADNTLPDNGMNSTIPAPQIIPPANSDLVADLLDLGE